MERLDGRTAAAEATLRADARADSRQGRRDEPFANPLRPLRPLTVGQALDLGFELFRIQGRRLVPIATLLYLPIQLVDLALRMGLSSGEGSSVLTTSGASIGALGGMRVHEPFILAAQSVALSTLGICCGFMTAAMMNSEFLPFGEVVVRGLKRLHVSVVIAVLSALTYLVLACVPVIGVLVAGALTFMASVAAGAEDLGPVVAMKRSFKLARANLGNAIGLFLGGLFLLWLTRGLLMLGPIALLVMLGAPQVVIDALGSASAILLVIVQPLTACMAAGAYVLFRTRCEGLDIHERVLSKVATV